MSTLFLVGVLPLLWLPGYLAVRHGGSPPADSHAPWSSTEKLFVEVAISALLLLWIGVTLATIGWFHPAVLLAVGALPLLPLVVAVARSSHALLRAPSFRVDGALLAVIALVVLGTQLYQPAFEQVVGGRDPTTYVVSGIHVAREGSWAFTDEVVTAIPAEHREAFLGPDRRANWGHWGSRLLGWYLMDADSGRVVPQGLPLYPTAIAFGYLAADVQGAVHATRVLAIAAVVALFLLGRRWLNPAVGLTAAALLLVSPAQVWFSRYANAETIAQLLLLLGLYGLIVYRRHGGWAFAFMAGVALGLSWQAHIFTVWLVLPLGGILVYDLLEGRVDRTAALALWLPLVVLGLQALYVYFGLATAYLWGVYTVVKWSAWALVPLVPAAIMLLAGLWLWGRRSVSDGSGSTASSGRGRWARPALAAAVIGAAIYGYWLRPLVTNAWYAEAVPRLTLATTFAVFGFAVAGVALLLLDRRRGAATTCAVIVALGIMVPVLWEPNITRALMWSLRRYQTFLPLVFLFAVVPLWGNAPAERRRRGPPLWTRPLLALVTVFLFLPLAAQGLQYRGFKEPGETIALVDHIDASLEDDAVLIFEARSGWGVLDLAPALAFWKGHDVVWLQNKDTPDAALLDFVRRQAQRGRPVYFFTQGFNYYVRQPRMVPHRRWWYSRNQLEEVRGRLPERVLDARMPLSSYRVEPAGYNGPLEGGLDVGHWDDIYVGEALPWEVTGQLTARWTKGRSFFWLPGLDESHAQIVVHAGTIRNTASYGRTLTARLDGIRLGEIPLQQDWTDYVFDVPSDWRPTAGEAPLLELMTQVLQPAEVDGGDDSRYLGVFVNAILWR